MTAFQSLTPAWSMHQSIEDAVRFITTLGRGSLLAKIDIANSFRLLPVHPSDCHLLGMHWEDQLFIDQQLPFGLRSAPVEFNAYAGALRAIVAQCMHDAWVSGMNKLSSLSLHVLKYAFCD